MSNAAFANFVLMNLDLVAVPLQVDPSRVVTVFCGERRASQLLGGLGSEARRPGEADGAQVRACRASIARNVVALQSG